MFKVKSYAVSDIGLKRKTNQDAFLVSDDLFLYVVADGMGGHRGGEVASSLAVEVMKEYCEKNKTLPGRDLLDKAVNASCSAIYQKALENTELSGMGTTIVAVLFQQGAAFVAQVGDSRVYLVRPEGLWQVTEDHSLVNEEIRAGRLAAGQEANYQFRNVITRSVGYENKVVVDIYRRTLREHDTFLLCTDGLSGLVSSAEIAETLKNVGNEKGTQALVDLANSRGGDDNVTVLTAEVLSL